MLLLLQCSLFRLTQLESFSVTLSLCSLFPYQWMLFLIKRKTRGREWLPVKYMGVHNILAIVFTSSHTHTHTHMYTQHLYIQTLLLKCRHFDYLICHLFCFWWIWSLDSVVTNDSALQHGTPWKLNDLRLNWWPLLIFIVF